MSDNLTLSNSTVRILAIEDDDVDREVYTRLLSRTLRKGRTYLLTFAASKEKALKHSVTGNIDCILVDYKLPGKLPGFTGLEFIEELYENGTDSLAPVILVTGGAIEELVTSAKRVGATSCLSKESLSTKCLEESIINAINNAHR